MDAQIISYEDAATGTTGALAFSGHRHRLAAGGLRVRAGVTPATTGALAEAMALKQRLLGLGVDGAKAGLDLDPHDPRKEEVLARFIGFLRPHLEERLSMGPDMGTTWAEVEGLAAAGGASLKGAIARAQGLTPSDFHRRVRLLDAPVDAHLDATAGRLTLGQRRAGHAVAHATLAVARRARSTGQASARVTRVGLQGFGTLGRGAALSLAEAGVRITAVADEHTCLSAARGLDIGALLALPPGLLPCDGGTTGAAGEPTTGPPAMLFEAPVDVLVLASCENAVSPEHAARLEAHSVVVGANLGLSGAAELVLDRLGVTVVPDFVAGCGGSASMDALFGPVACPSPRAVLDEVGTRIEELISLMLERTRRDGTTPRAAALALCEQEAPPGKPYGRWRSCSRAAVGA